MILNRRRLIEGLYFVGEPFGKKRKFVCPVAESGIFFIQRQAKKEGAAFARF